MREAATAVASGRRMAADLARPLDAARSEQVSGWKTGPLSEVALGATSAIER